MNTQVLELADVSVRRDDRYLLAHITWSVSDDQRWVILGPNGSGKTTLIRIAGLVLHPTAGQVTVLGQRLGHVDVRELRAHVGFVSSALAQQLRPQLSVRDVVMTARYGALEPWWHQYTKEDEVRAVMCLKQMGMEQFADRLFGTLSSGEQQRTLVARSLLNSPGLVLLDEPMAGLDFGSRESLVHSLSGLAGNSQAAPTVLVTHHVDEIPPGFTHVLVIREGKMLAAGSLEDTLTSELLSECYELPVELKRVGDRYSAHSR